jgi:hypothetical protein
MFAKTFSPSANGAPDSTPGQRPGFCINQSNRAESPANHLPISKRISTLLKNANPFLCDLFTPMILSLPSMSRAFSPDIRILVGTLGR